MAAGVDLRIDVAAATAAAVVRARRFLEEEHLSWRER
jgi:hypothetical protein